MSLYSRKPENVVQPKNSSIYIESDQKAQFIRDYLAGKKLSVSVPNQMIIENFIAEGKFDFPVRRYKLTAYLDERLSKMPPPKAPAGKPAVSA